MVLQVYDTMSQRKHELRPRDGKTFKMFICGPTVQDNVHLGHAKTYIAYDILARWLLKRGFKVQFLLNITDVDDKIFDRAKKENVPYMQIADKFYNEFLQDLEALNIQTVGQIERVSNYVDDAINLVEDLLRKGTAYELGGNTYFDISKANHFGKLSHQSEYELKLKQIDAAPGKRNPVDFFLWRKVPDGTEGAWNSQTLGLGRPGWHIEDTAIALSKLGGPYDLHGGATELIFPHHEAELAQDEAISGEIPFVSVWMHTGLLLKDGEKMSKSLGNVIKIQDALKEYTGDEIRFYFLKHHYRESFDIDLKALSKVREELATMVNASKALPKNSKSPPQGSIEENENFQNFTAALDDDLNSPKALQALLKTSEEILENQVKSDKVSSVFWEMVECLGFRFF